MIILLLRLALSAVVITLAVLVSFDGYGTRPPPRSHHQDAFEPGLSSDQHLTVR